MVSFAMLLNNKPALSATWKLRPNQRALFGQTIGYPATQKKEN
jgi:hypothetical protein